GINFFLQEVAAKRLRLLHELVPKAVRIAVLVNRPMLRLLSRRYGTCRKPHPPSDCKSRFSTPRRSARSMRPLPILRATAPTPFSLLPTDSSSATAVSLPP